MSAKAAEDSFAEGIIPETFDEVLESDLVLAKSTGMPAEAQGLVVAKSAGMPADTQDQLVELVLTESTGMPAEAKELETKATEMPAAEVQELEIVLAESAGMPAEAHEQLVKNSPKSAMVEEQA